jgi:hypothetical protein
MEVLLDGKGLVRADQVQVFVPPVGERAVVLVTTGFGTPNRNMFLFADGKKVMGTDCPMIQGVHFSPDGMHTVADCQTLANSHLVLTDGKRGQEYQSIQYYGFTPDSSKPIYIALQAGKSYVVVGDQESDGYSALSVFTPNKPPLAIGNGGKRIGFTAVDGGNCLAWINGKVERGSMPACPSNFDFSPDGSRYAYVLGNKPQTVSVDGAPSLPVSAAPFLSLNSPYNGGKIDTSYVFSPDSKHVAYSASLTTNFQPGIVIDGKFVAIPTNPGVDMIYPVFTPDSKHFYVTARTPVPNQPSAFQLTVFLDGRPSARVEGAVNTMLMNPWAWEMSADGTLTVLLGDGADLKRVRITPSNDSSVDTMLAAAQPIK